MLSNMSITLSQLVLGVAVAAVILTVITAFVFKNHKSWLMTFLQNFCGALFIFSGYVKAVDPLGTGYKMEQYFTEFQSTFEGTWFSFIAPMFPWLSQYASSFSVFMIVLEIVLGVMLIIGSKPKWTAWLFLLIVVFFTVLTGFTFLTGYVPDGVNFFSFSSWADYNANNMKVTDCGCFGDFLKLEPKVSFFKDLVLLVPAFYFLFKHKEMHQWIKNSKIEWGLLGGLTLVTLIFCLSNFVWDIPDTDFRPFKKGADIRTQRSAEEDAMANVQIVAWKLKNKNDGKVIELPNAQYMANFKDYPKTEWEIIDQIKTEPAIKQTKISEFEITTPEGNDATYEVLEDATYKFMIISYKMYGAPKEATRTVIDSTFSTDTITLEDGTQEIVKKLEGTADRTVTYYDYIWESDFKENYTEEVAQLVNAAAKDQVGSYVVVGGASIEMIDDFKGETGLKMPFYTADDILLKTIVRSNPGVVLWKDGKIIHKWHVDQLPSYQEIKSAHMR